MKISGKLVDENIIFLQFFLVQPSYLEIGKGMAIPWCKDCTKDMQLQAIGIIGAVIMPHNLYLHSGLVKVSAAINLEFYFFPPFV